MSNENPTLKFTKLTKEETIKKVHELAVDAQWNLNNAKSPKGQREAQEELNLFGSACEYLKGEQTNG